MKRIASFILSGLLLAGCATKEQTAPVSTLDVESLRDSVDLNMDITGLSLSDLRILENVFLAQKGYPFEDSYIRSIYQSTTWYDSLMWAFSENEDYYDQNSGYWGGKRNEELSYREEYYNSIKPEIIAYTDEQRAFVNRVRQREDELRKLNFKSGNEDDKVNVANIVNPALLKEPDQRLWDYLGHHGFAIVPAQHQQLFHVYEQNDYHEFPAFVTTDLYLQLYHLYFDCMLREVEQEKLMPLLKEFCEEGQKVFARRWQREKENEDAVFNTDGAAEWIVTYFKVANALLEEQAPRGDADALGEYERVMKSTNATSEFLEYTDVPFEYSLFRPRGHYTRNDNLKRYFRTMMWLQTVPLRSDNPFDMLKANILAVELCDDHDNPRLYSLYKKLTEPMNYLMGMPDDVSIEQVNKIISDIGTCEIDPNELGVKVDEIAEKQTRIRPKFLRTGRNKVRLMPQRYQPDAEVLQEMVDYDSNTTKRGVPKGLDVFAAMGVSAAEKILMDELNEPDRWSKYTSNLKRMKKRMNEIKWEENAATQWMSALKTVIDKPQHAPYFMLSPEWDKKSLNAMLGSWTELKHDAILYAKQPMGAECGGAGPPDPIVKGYVEPNVKFWQKAIDLLKENQKILRTHNLLTEKIATANERLTEEAEFLLAISKKELRGEVLKDVEYDELEYIGAKFENMSLELLRDSEHELWDWEAIQGPDRKVALVADVYTANADNNPNKSILYEAVGDADEIYVVVEIGGYLWLTRGAVFSYREFQRSIDDQRLNDEEWQEYLERHPRSGVPEWMTPVTVPLEKTPVDNESVFYSTGC
ncbi:MAG: DUF3160 domain-containing protein [Prevotella sp.]|nr:DUF3160 domain-containing protein [Prevotella sp.]